MATTKLQQEFDVRSGVNATSSESNRLDQAEVESQIRLMGEELLRSARQSRPKLFSSRFWSDQLMTWAMHDPAFKVQLFRFVDVFPMLGSSRQVHDYLVEYLSQPGVTLPSWMELGLKAGGLAKGVFAAAISNRISALAANFIAGPDAESALPQLHQRWTHDVAFSVDLLGEACLSEEESLAYQQRYLDLIQTLARETSTWKASPRLEADHLGPIPRANVSIKISSLNPRIDPINYSGSLARLEHTLHPILEAAGKHGVFINFDMEQHSLKELTLELFRRCCEEYDFAAGIALQAYLRSAEDDARRLADWAKAAGRQITVRLIKGAYWDYEVIHTEQTGWPVPVWLSKRETDAAFERVAAILLAAAPRTAEEGGIRLAVGTHNVRSIAAAFAIARQVDLPGSAVEVQMLYGMADQLKAAVLEQGLRLREYVPVGEMIPGMAYLVRRLLENTSNQSWLRAGFFEDAPDALLLASPHVAFTAEEESVAEPPDPAKRHQLAPGIEGLADGRPFFNEPPRDFADVAQRESFGAAVRAARVPDGIERMTAERLDEAIARAERAFSGWSNRDPLDRARLLVEGASRMRARRDELAGILIREAGKTWREADADVCEAIDFCEYYARKAVALFRPQRLGRFVGELNEIFYQPRGVAAIISPWNFPLAILTGMTTAALATGNTALVKPSSQTQGIARRMCELLWEAGTPVDVLQFAPGSGSVVGAGLVRDPRVALIAFTGSKEVGLDILRTAAQTPEEQGFIKKVVCEMGGKNAIIVDESADLDEAVQGVRQSAFGYAGQKCSACSRAIVVGDAYEVFLHRLIEATRALVVGDPLSPTTDVGPVIDSTQAEKIRRYIEIGKTEGRLELAVETPEQLDREVGKPFVGPHIFSGIEPQHRLAREEIFGPVLSVMHAADFDQAIRWANQSDYKLTGGVYSRRPSHLDRARREFRVGNLYLNRGITGALVGRQPFGGFGLSGTGTQAGGPDYLAPFVEPRACSENTLRHGFAPGLE